jgi:hypothetical protein
MTNTQTRTVKSLAKNIVAGELIILDGGWAEVAEVHTDGGNTWIYTQDGEAHYFLAYASIPVILP